MEGKVLFVKKFTQRHEGAKVGAEEELQVFRCGVRRELFTQETFSTIRADVHDSKERKATRFL